MAIQNIVIGTPGAGGGDPAHAAFTKINQNFSNQQHAASRMVGAADGNVMEVGAFGLGGTGRLSAADPYIQLEEPLLRPTQMISFLDNSNAGYGQGLSWSVGNRLHGVVGDLFAARLFHVYLADVTAPTVSRQTTYSLIRTSANTTVDGNGFLKNASPIVQLFADKIELNDEAQLQEIMFEKLGVGDYLIKGSSGFAQEGWYIETPKDANGNVLFSVIYTTLENGDISVKTYKKKFDFETVSIVADLDNPVDITKNRWIDLRLQELPQPEIEMPESIAPPEFQPTGLAQAVATVMESYHDSEQ